ncbi:hypothetical protein ACFVH6_43955 [Spirillospora sp. NPDC127200]
MIPFIDADLRTIATRQARATAGISMGGFGAFHRRWNQDLVGLMPRLQSSPAPAG